MFHIYHLSIYSCFISIFRVGILLSKYKSGKIPKAFKIIPTFEDWGSILELTEPSNWTFNATFEATRVFISNLDPKMSEIFLVKYLLPKIRDNIKREKELNYHLYQSVRKSLYKPAAFFKGILLPICQDENSTLKEAAIIGSIVSKSSIPYLYSATALLQIANMPFTGVRAFFMRILIDKKYALPEKVILALLNYFDQTSIVASEGGRGEDLEELPVLWHQALLSFCQRYKLEFDDSSRNKIKSIITRRFHHQISKEIEEELASTSLIRFSNSMTE